LYVLVAMNGTHVSMVLAASFFSLVNNVTPWFS